MKPGSLAGKIAVVGTGYVGLTTGVCLAELGHNVICVDKDDEKIGRLSSGECVIFEDQLEQILRSNLDYGRIAFTTDLIEACRDSEFIFLCLPTPENEDGSADLTALLDVAGKLNGQLRTGTCLVIKSTVPVKSSEQVSGVLTDSNIAVVSNPEFLREGTAVFDFMSPDRIVIGSSDRSAAERVASLYLKLQAPIVITDCASAEAIKYLSNAFLAVKLSFVNEAAQLCDALGADVLQVMKGLSFDTRIGAKFLQPGPGWGGSCFPKDTQSLIQVARAAGRPVSVVEAASVSNDQHAADLVTRVKAYLSSSLVDAPRIGVLGLTFKAGTDDVRESPSLRIINELSPACVEIVGYDPQARDQNLGKLTRVRSVEDAIRGVDALLVLTEWEEFRHLEPRTVKSLMRGSVIFDFRYLLDEESFRHLGLSVITVGRHSSNLR